MTAETHSQLANFIWSICNLLRGPYKRNEYRKVILPLTVLRRFDCVLAPTKADVLREHAAIKTKPENIIRHKLNSITGHAFYNLSKLDLPRLLDDPNQLAPNLNSYINGFSPNVRAIMERFDFGTQIAKMAEKDLLYLVIKAFAAIDLSPERVDPVILGSDVALHYYRLEQAATGAINIREGDPEGVKSPTDVGTGKAPEKKAPLSEIIEVLNSRFGTEFTEEDRLFFEQIKEKAVKTPQVIDTALSNPLDKFQLGVKKLVEDLMIQRLADNDEIVTRYMDDEAFQSAAFPILAKEIFASINAAAGRKTIEEIISGGENNTTEFKSTLRVNLHTREPDPKIEHAALKTIAAFLNSREGGILVIGVKDDGEVLGVEADGFPNEDKMNLHLVNLIKARLGAASMLNIKPHFEDYKGKRLLVVDCLSSSSPVYLKNGNTEEFYIRAGASSAALPASEMTTYIQQRYN